MRLLHKELSYELRGCFYYVHNQVGLGYDEETYHLALAEHLRRKKIHFESKPFRYIAHRGRKVHKLVADFLIDNKVIVELKCTPLDFVPANYLQTISYLKGWNIELGWLVNFGQESVIDKRMIFTEKEPQLVEDYEEIRPYINSENSGYLRSIRSSILTVLYTHGLGYDSTIYKELLEEEFRFNNLPYAPNLLIPIAFEEKIIRNYELKFPIVKEIICGVFAVQETIKADISKMKNYLKRTGYPIGLVIHFGKEKLEIIGVSQ